MGCVCVCVLMIATNEEVFILCLCCVCGRLLLHKVPEVEERNIFCVCFIFHEKKELQQSVRM